MDIKANVNYSLEGKFKVDIYDKNNNFVSSTDWFNNFITPTGLSYIYRYKFADCFKFLSLGKNFSAPNHGNANGGYGTTGLSGKIDFIITDLNSGLYPDITELDGVWYTPGQEYTGTLKAQYVGDWGYKESNGNSIVEGNDGPRFYRTWRVPFYYDSVITGGDLELGEFMVSPSSGEDSLGNKAFSRVRRNVIIPDQTYAYISYQLGVKLSSTQIQIFSGGTFDTGKAEISYEGDEVGNWSNLSGYYRQTYHGLAWIDIKGNTFVPKYGAIMEPSWTGMDECRFYLSPDNGQFNVSSSGGSQQSENEAYLTDGLLKFIVENPYTEESSRPIDNSVPPLEILKKNIRYNGDTKSPWMYDYRQDGSNDLSQLKSYDYQTFSNATPGVNQYATGLYTGVIQFGNKVLISTKGFNLPISGSQTGRSRALIRRHSFFPSQSLGKNTRFGALVYAYKNKTLQNNYYPMIDCMFFDSSGQHIMAHYREITGIYMTNRGSGIIDAETYTIPELDKPFNHRTFQGPGTGDWTKHPAIPQEPEVPSASP